MLYMPNKYGLTDDHTACALRALELSKELNLTHDKTVREDYVDHHYFSDNAKGATAYVGEHESGYQIDLDTRTENGKKDHFMLRDEHAHDENGKFLGINILTADVHSFIPIPGPHGVMKFFAPAHSSVVTADSLAGPDGKRPPYSIRSSGEQEPREEHRAIIDAVIACKTGV